MKKFTLLLATMLLVCVVNVFSEEYSAVTYSFQSTSLANGLSVTGTHATASGGYYKMSAGDYAEITAAALNFSDTEVLSTDMTINVACGTFGTWSNPKTITLTAAFYDAAGQILSSQTFTTETLNSTGTEFRGNFVLPKPLNPSIISKLRVTFTKLTSTSGGSARFTNVQLSYTTGTPKALSKITISDKNVTKKEYVAGDTFDVTELIATGEYSDGSTDDITKDVTWTATPQILTAGIESIKVEASYGEITGSITITGISVREPNQYTITWMTMQGESTTTAIEGQAIAAPADPTYAGKVFMGWSQNNSVAADGADFTAVDFTATTATANVTYYAVFATKSVGGEPVYKKITSNDELTDGKYLLVATVSNLESYAAGTKGEKQYSNAVAVTVTDDVISDKATAVEFSIVMVDGTTNFAMNDGENWLTSTASKADITYTEVEQAAPTDAYWKLTTDGYVQSTNTTSNRYFGYNTQATRFAAYASTSGQQIGAQLYKYSQSITTTDYVVAAYLEVEPAAIDFGELKDNENMSEKAEIVIALGHNLSEDITATLPEDAQFTIVSEPDGEGSLMVTVTPKPVIGTNEATLTFTSGICTATVALKAVIVKGTATGIDDAATSAVFTKMIENGQLVIVREGVKYNAQGAVIR